jgi:hypothetical protein
MHRKTEIANRILANVIILHGVACKGDREASIFILNDDELQTHIQNATVEDLVIEALQIEGVHHKQYYLVQIAKKLRIDLSHVRHERGIPP